MYTVGQRLVRMLTRGEEKRLRSAHYMMGALEYNNVETMQRVVNQEVGEMSLRRVLCK